MVPESRYALASRGWTVGAGGDGYGKVAPNGLEADEMERRLHRMLRVEGLRVGWGSYRWDGGPAGGRPPAPPVSSFLH